MYAYKRTEPGLYTVGFYTPGGDWIPESDHDSREAAAARVNYLNGGQAPSRALVARLQDALGTAETGDGLVDVARAAHAAEQRLAALERKQREQDEPEDCGVRQTCCRHCGLDIEGFAPYPAGSWRDRGNNSHCPESDGGRAHDPY